ncbi:MAG: VWA domain-containing protein [Rhizobiaceae bacterium]
MTIKFRRLILSAAMMIVMSVASLGGTLNVQAKTIDLGFLLDRSGSIGNANYTTAKNALAAALAQIPVQGATADTYRVSVVSFSSSITTVVAPTIVTVASIGGIQTAITGDAYSGGSTNMNGAIDAMVAAFAGAGGLGDLSLMNMTTDGQPCCGASSTNATTIAARDAAVIAGWDGLSVEAIGGGVDIAFLKTLVFPGTPAGTVDVNNIPNPAVAGFVLAVTNFDQYGAAISAKVQAIVDTQAIPVPAALPLFGTGLALMGFLGWRRKQKLA